MNERNPGTIITFYSYKGGTGRTMALANTACLLARRLTVEKMLSARPPRILAIDWDFEAPGLHHYFKDLLTQRAQAAFDDAPGCIDLFVEMKASASQYTPGDFVGNRNLARNLLSKLDFDRYMLQTAIPGLSIIKSGRHDINYPQVVNQFDWNSFFHNTFGLFNGFADYLRDRFDYVLVDSRTGVTDTSGICTMLLPDKLVAVFTLNRQSLSGLEDLIFKAVAYRKSSPDGRALTVFPLASRIEIAKPQMFDAWRKGSSALDNTFPGQAQPIVGYQPIFERLFQGIYNLKTLDMTEYFNEVQIQHIPDYAYGEPIAVELETDSRISLRRSYESFADRLVELDMPWLSLQEARLGRKFVQRCDEITDKIANNRIDEALRMAWILYENRLPDKTLEKTTETVLKVAQAAYPLYRQEVSNLIRKGADLLLSDYKLDISYLAGWGNEVGSLCLEFGDYHNALWLFDQIWKKLEASLGTEHIAVLSVLKNLGRTLSALGRYTEARKVQKRILDTNLQWFGEEHPDTINSMKNLAKTLQAQGELAQAKIFAEKALQSSIRVLGGEHPETLNAMSNLAETLQAQGELAQARIFAEKALQSSIRVLGGEHPETLNAMSNLAKTLQAQGELTQARAFAEKALQSSIRVLGEEHPETLKTMSNLAVTLYELGDFEQARMFAEKALQSSMRVLGDEHPETLNAIGILTAMLYALGDLGRARMFSEKALQSSMRVLGNEHPETLTAMSNLGLTLYAQGDLEQAKMIAEKALHSSIRVLGEAHPDTLKLMHNLAVAMRKQGELSEAQILQEKVLDLSSHRLGAEHSSTINTMRDLALTLLIQGNSTYARELQEKALDILRRTRGNDHPNTRVAMKDLAETLKIVGETDKALELFSEAAKSINDSNSAQRSVPWSPNSQI